MPQSIFKTNTVQWLQNSPSVCPLTVTKCQRSFQVGRHPVYKCLKGQEELRKRSVTRLSFRQWKEFASCHSEFVNHAQFHIKAFCMAKLFVCHACVWQVIYVYNVQCTVHLLHLLYFYFHLMSYVLYKRKIFGLKARWIYNDFLIWFQLPKHRCPVSTIRPLVFKRAGKDYTIISLSWSRIF